MLDTTTTPLTKLPTSGNVAAHMVEANTGSGELDRIIDLRVDDTLAHSDVETKRDTEGSSLTIDLGYERYTDRISQQFETLADEWAAHTSHLSQIERRVMHPSYQRIIAMGPVVLPLILRRLRDQPDHWFWALNLLASDSPIPSDFRGTVSDAIDLWIKWGEQKGYL